MGHGRYKIASFNMFKFSAYTNKDVDRIATQINREGVDIIAIQEIFSQAALNRLLLALGPKWEGRWDTPNSRSVSAAEGYAFAWRKDSIELTRNREGKVFEPRILNQYSLNKKVYKDLVEKYSGMNVDVSKLPFQERLLRNPYYARFSPSSLPGGTYFEFRVVNTHIMYSADRQINESEDKEDILRLSDIARRKNEYNILTHAVYPKVSNKDVDYLMGQTNAKYLPSYTLLVGDYNLNLDEYPRIDNPMVEITDGVGKNATYNPDGVKRIRTIQREKTTLKAEKRLEVDPLDAVQSALLMTHDDRAFYANNYDHITYDEVAFSPLNIIDTKRLIWPDKMYGDMAKDDPYRPYREYRKNVSDHLPIMIEIDIKGAV